MDRLTGVAGIMMEALQGEGGIRPGTKARIYGTHPSVCTHTTRHGTHPSMYHHLTPSPSSSTAPPNGKKRGYNRSSSPRPAVCATRRVLCSSWTRCRRAWGARARSGGMRTRVSDGGTRSFACLLACIDKGTVLLGGELSTYVCTNVPKHLSSQILTTYYHPACQCQCHCLRITNQPTNQPIRRGAGRVHLGQGPGRRRAHRGHDVQGTTTTI